MSIPEALLVIDSFTFLSALILVPLLVHLRGRKPAALFFAVAVVYAVFGAVNFALIQIFLSQSREAEHAYHDTRYVVSHGYFLVSIGITMAVLGAITWIQTRFGAMRYPALTKILFWILHIAVIGITSTQEVFAFFLPMPRRYVDYPVYVETLNLIILCLVFLSATALLGLTCLLLWSIITKWRAQ